MHKLAAGIGALALAIVSGCKSDDIAESGAEAETSSTAGDGDGDGECTPPAGVFGDCGSGTDACMTDGPKLCVLDGQDNPTVAVCARRCTDLCDCWAAPADGDAPVACLTIDQSGDKTCVLDCSSGQTCPTGMVCAGDIGTELCMYPQM
jgi:hypothetical protein